MPSPSIALDSRPTVVIFGASGDLTSRKIVPALYNLWKDGYLAKGALVVGVARREKSDGDFRGEMFEGCRDHSRQQVRREDFDEFAKWIHYHVLDFTQHDKYDGLRERLETLERENDGSGDRLLYLATLPSQFATVTADLGEHDLIREPGEARWSRVVIEKPFGADLASARKLNESLRKTLDESQIYRIDHYLGKDTVQNILSFRLGNSIFEPLFNHQFVNHVEITVAESIGIESARGAYYDQTGAMRDMIQNHALQLLCLVAMEPPAEWSAREIRNEKLKVLKNLGPRDIGNPGAWAVRGQYGPGGYDQTELKGYRQEDRVDPESTTPTYVALRAEVNNWRWSGVPFFVRSGKRLPKRVTEIAVTFRTPPLRFFKTVECVGDVCDITHARPNALIFRIQPDEKISLSLSVKRPGMEIDLHPVTMDFEYEGKFAFAMPEAYERLLLEALRGDASLFMRSDEVEAAWEYISPILDRWEAQPPDDFPNYPAGTWGPHAADCLFSGMEGAWRKP